MQDFQVERVRPPFGVAGGGGDGVSGSAVRDGAFGFGGRPCRGGKFFFHIFLFVELVNKTAYREAWRGAHLVQSPRKMSSHSRRTRLPRERGVGRGTSYQSMS